MTRWERKRKQNHWLDALYNACAAGHWCGVRLVEEAPRPAPPQPRPAPRKLRADGRPWIDTERWMAMQKRYWGR